MDQSFRESVGGSAGKLIPSLLMNPKIYDRVHKSPPLASDLSNINPDLIFTTSLRRI
jgi:hypothetical protein